MFENRTDERVLNTTIAMYRSAYWIAMAGTTLIGVLLYLFRNGDHGAIPVVVISIMSMLLMVIIDRRMQVDEYQILRLGKVYWAVLFLTHILVGLSYIFMGQDQLLDGLWILPTMGGPALGGMYIFVRQIQARLMPSKSYVLFFAIFAIAFTVGFAILSRIFN